MKNDRFISIGMLIILLSSFEAVRSQNMTIIHDTIYSEILKEKRAIEIMLPGIQKTNTNERYDVLYVTDGEWNTKIVSPIYEFLADKWLIPKNIIIGVPHNNLEGVNLRERDLIPPHDNVPLSGRADNFLSFFKNELIPYVNKNYPTSGKNTICGGSLGGVFIIYALLSEPQLFDSYIAGDPAFWWDDYYINKFAADKLHNFSDTKTLIMTGRGTKDGSDFRSMGIYSMDSIITAKAPSGLHWKSLPYLDETHRSILLKTIYDGLRFTYHGYGEQIGFNPMNGVLLRNKPIRILPEDNSYHLNLRYTTDGTEPTETSAEFRGMDLTGGVTLKLKLFSPSGRFDQTVTGNFKLGDVFPALSKPKNIKPGGLTYLYFQGEWNSLPNFKNLKPDESGSIGQIYNSYGEFNFPKQPKLTCRMEGYLEIKEDGYYSFLIDTDAETKLYINDQLIIAYNGVDKNKGFQTYVLPLEKGFYAVRLEHFQKKRGSGLRFNYVPPGLKPMPIPLNFLYSSPVSKTK